MVLSYQIHHLDKRNCKKKERTYQTLGWKGNQHKGPLLPGSLKIWRGELDSKIGDDNDDYNADDHHNDNVQLPLHDNVEQVAGNVLAQIRRH